MNAGEVNVRGEIIVWLGLAEGWVHVKAGFGYEQY